MASDADKGRDFAADLALCNAATPPAWEWDEDDDCMRLMGDQGLAYQDALPIFKRHGLQILKAPRRGTPYAEYWPCPADAAFIAAAREGWPAALHEVARLRAGLDRIRRAVENGNEWVKLDAGALHLMITDALEDKADG